MNRAAGPVPEASLPRLPFCLETALERAIAADPDWQTGLAWGAPRRGHPEGQVLWHIRDVLENVGSLYGRSAERARLRQIALIHDTFKYQVDRAAPRGPANTHEYFARRFAERYLTDLGVLEVIELHDSAYKAHRLLARTGDSAEAARQAQALLARLGAHLDLYMMFYLCDNRTGDKSMEHYQWFRRIAVPTPGPTPPAET
jgi:hypothetical protein